MVHSLARDESIDNLRERGSGKVVKWNGELAPEMEEGEGGKWGLGNHG